MAHIADFMPSVMTVYGSPAWLNTTPLLPKELLLKIK